MTFKAMVFKDRINGNIVWADIQLINLKADNGSLFRVARPIAIDIPKLLPMTAFITMFQKGIVAEKISDEVNWDKLELIEIQIKPKGLILTVN